MKKLLQATWRGVPFFIRSEGMTEAGRRIIFHDYPNSNQRYIEDMGEIPPKFRLEAFVMTTKAADQLEHALKEEGPGRLTMPVFGAMTLYAMPYQKDASQQSVNEISFSLEFIKGEPVSGPTQEPATTETVYAAGDNARVTIGDALEEKWIIPYGYATSFVSQFDLKEVLNSVMPLDAIVSNATKFTQVVGYIKLNIAAAVQTAIGLKTTLVDNLWQTLSEGLLSGTGLFSIMEMFSFGNDNDLTSCDLYGASSSSGGIPLWPDTTVSRQTRNTNRINMVNTHRVCALVTAYECAAAKTYSTTEDIDQVRFQLEAGYNQIMREDTSNPDIIQADSAVRSAVDKVRIAALTVLRNKEQNAYSTVTINRQEPISAFVLAYLLYEDIEQTDTLRELNIDQSSIAMSGNIEVLQWK